jgi:hypothetical protein
MLTLPFPRVARSRSRKPTGFSNSAAVRRLMVEPLEPRLALCGAGCLEVELIPELDQFGNQLETVMGYIGPGEKEEQARISFALYDTGASVVTYSASDQLLYDLLGSPIPIKVEGGASADAIGGVLTGDVSQPGEIIAAGLHAVTITDTLEFGINFEPQIDLDGDGVPDPTAVRTPGVQAFVGTVEGSPFLPTITGTVVHNQTVSHPDGVAVHVDMTAYQLDFGALFPEIPEFEGIVVDLPDLYFVEPGRKLTAPDDSITDPVRIPMDLWGESNYENPGDLITTTPNPVQTGVTLRQGAAEVADQTLVFDTGAQLTVISTEIAEGLGLDLLNPEIEIEVQGAAGRATIPGFTVDAFEMPRDDDGDGVLDGVLRFTNVPIYVLDVVPGIGGLIGMNLFNTAKEMLYDPFDPDGPSLQLTFFADPLREIPDPEQEAAIEMLSEGNPIFGGWFGGQGLPSFGIEVPPPVNSPPTAAVDAAVTMEDAASTIDVLANDTDLDGDPLTINHVSDPGNGSAVINVDNTILYTPDAGFSGDDSFTYTIHDGNGGEATATVNITVNPVPGNNAPQAADDNVTTTEGVQVVIDVLANDTDPDGDPLTITLVSDPANGSASISAENTILYTPIAGFTEVSFTYTISDGNGGEATATVNITVNPAPGNNAPQAADDNVATDEDTQIVINVLTNDGDPDGDPLTVVATTSPTHGTIVIGGDNSITYTPEAEFHGADSFSYTIRDDSGAEATATVNIVVNSINDAPTSIELTGDSVDEDSPGAAIGAVTVADPDAGDTHTFIVSDDRFEIAGGVLRLKPGESIDFETEPSVALTITATDSGDPPLLASQEFVVSVNDLAEPEHPWQNPDPDLRSDVDGDGAVAIADLLALVLAIREHQLGFVLPPQSQVDDLPPFPDVNGDDRLDLTDVLQTVQKLRDDLVRPPVSAEGELGPIESAVRDWTPLEDVLDLIAGDAHQPKQVLPG